MRDLIRSLGRLRLHHVVLVGRVWATFFGLVVRLRRRTLPEVVDALNAAPRRHPRRRPPGRLSRTSYRLLRLGPYRPRCLYRALVLFRLLRLQGDRPVLVIGLPEAATGKDAHAWVELEGEDIGPPPGRAGHAPFVRYPQPSPHSVP
jgi:hypothetical protein